MTVAVVAAHLRGSLFLRHRLLIWEMAKREHSDRYSGSVLGLVWAIGHPLFLMSVYVVVFGYVFRVRVGGTHDLPLDYTAYLMAGYLPWMAFLESMSKACVTITASANLVKQVVFPVEVLPLKGAVAAVVTQLVGTAFLVAYVFVVHGTAWWTYLLFPILLGLQLLAMAGVALALAAIGPFFRDIKDLVQVASVAGVYLMPVVFLPEWVPNVLRPLLYLNPFSYMVWCYQDVFYFGRLQHPAAWLVFAAGSLAAFAGGRWVFARLKIYFGNVL